MGMDKKKDALQAIQNFAEKQPERSEQLEQKLAQARQLTAQLYGEGRGEQGKEKGTVIAAGRRWLLPAVLCGAALLLVLGILLTYFLLERRGPVYYDSSEIYGETVTDIVQFKEENQLNFLYYDDNSLPSQYRVSRLIENDRIMYLIQDTMLVSQYGFDTVSLGICFSEDTFLDFDAFSKFTDSLTVEEVSAEYRVETGDANYIYAKFTVDGVVYYLNISTAGGSEVLESCIQQLLS